MELKRIKKEKGIERLTEVLVKNDTPICIEHIYVYYTAYIMDKSIK